MAARAPLGQSARVSAGRRPVEILWEHLAAPARARAGAPEALEPVLDQRLRAARDAWRGIDLPDAVFLPYLSARLEDAPSPVEALRALHVEDLYLACACAEGDRAALAAFDGRYIAGLDAVLRRTSRKGVQPDDIKQVLRQKLFVGEPGGRPKIADYAGRGDLRRWVRAVAMRSVIDAVRSEKEIPTEEELLGALELHSDHPEIAHLKEASRAEFKAAFRDALGSLGDRERLLLLQYYLDGSTLEALGALYGVVPSTISRSLAKARATLLARVRASLMERMRISGREVDSLVRLIQSQFELSTNLTQKKR